MATLSFSLLNLYLSLMRASFSFIMFSFYFCNVRILFFNSFSCFRLVLAAIYSLLYSCRYLLWNCSYFSFYFSLYLSLSLFLEVLYRSVWVLILIEFLCREIFVSSKSVAEVFLATWEGFSDSYLAIFSAIYLSLSK